jgi:hypothetical protein
VGAKSVFTGAFIFSVFCRARQEKRDDEEDLIVIGARNYKIENLYGSPVPRRVVIAPGLFISLSMTSLRLEQTTDMQVTSRLLHTVSVRS